MHPIKSLVVILFLNLPCQIHAADIHVSNQGLDTSPGTSERPLRTLLHAGELAKAGDTVIIHAGTYRETLTIRHSGTVDRPLTFTAAKGANVILSGSDTVKDWRPHKGSIVTCKIPKSLDRGFNQVFLNGRMLPMARFPNETSGDLHKATFIDMQAAKNHITSARLNQPDGFWNGGFVVGGFGHKWTFQCATIKDYQPGKLTLSGQSSPWFDGNGAGYVAGVLGALDAPGEWHIEGQSLYLWPPKDVNLANAQVEVKQRNLCVDFNGQSYVVVQGIGITTGTVRLVGNSNLLENCTVTYPSHFTRFPWSGYSSEGGVDKGHNGILIQGNRNTLRGCDVRYSAGSGVVVKGFKNVVTRCEISNIDYAGTYSCPIALRSLQNKAYGENRIWFNTIRRTGRDCIHLHGASADDIRYNDISESGLICKDLGIVYAWGRDGRGTRIAYNWVHDNKGTGPNPGIYLDNYASGYAVHDNVIAETGTAGIFFHLGWENRVVNNVFFESLDVKYEDGAAQIVAEAEDDAQMNNTFERNVVAFRRTPTRALVHADDYLDTLFSVVDHNTYYIYGKNSDQFFFHNDGLTTIGNWSVWTSSGFDTHSTVAADPLFVDADALDLCLDDASPAYAAGFTRIPDAVCRGPATAR